MNHPPHPDLACASVTPLAGGEGPGVRATLIMLHYFIQSLNFMRKKTGSALDLVEGHDLSSAEGMGEDTTGPLRSGQTQFAGKP